MSDNMKVQLLSALNTFLTAIAVTLPAALAGGITWTLAFWATVGVTVLRAGVKAVINSFVPVRLGGRK